MALTANSVSTTGTVGTEVGTPVARRRPNRWFPRGVGGIVPDVVNGVLQGTLCIFSAFAYAVLIFSHLPGNALAAGIGIGIAGMCVMTLIVAFAAKLQPVFCIPQDTTSVILALMAGSVVATLETRNPAAILPTMLVLILISTLALGGTYLILGMLRLGQIVRYLPYPVIGGFLAGTGWLLLVGGVGMATAHPLTRAALAQPQTLSPTTIGELAAAIGFALVLMAAQHVFPHALTLACTLIAGAAGFYVVLRVIGVPAGVARADGWLLGALPPGHLLSVRWVGALGAVDWGTVIGQLGNVFTLVAIGVVAALLNLAGVEVVFGQNTDVNTELRALGVAGIAAGLAGGVGGYTALSRSSLAYRGGGRGALVPLVAGALALAVLLGGSTILSLMPRFLLAGVTMVLGGSLLADWLLKKRASLPAAEYAIVVLITLVIAIAGFFPGVLVGILAAVILFAVNYSRTGVIKHDLSGTAYASNVDWPLDIQRILRERRNSIHVYELQGYIFFGTAYRILERVRERSEQKATPLRFVILDFRNVTGLDSSATYSFSLLRQLAEESGFVVSYTYLAPSMRATLIPSAESVTRDIASAARLDTADDPAFVAAADAAGAQGDDTLVRVFADTDHALEWCEGRLIAGMRTGDGLSLAQRLANEMSDETSTTFTAEDIETRFLAHLERSEVAVGEYLTRMGAADADIYLLSAGQVAIILDLPGGPQVRLRLMNAGSLVGELSFYRRLPRSASVVATEPTVSYRVTWDAITRIQARDADMIAAFHAYVARVLSERLSAMNDTVSALLR